MKQVLQDRSGSTVVRDVPPPPCPPGFVLVRNDFSAISSGTEGARVAMSKKSLLGKARERPDLVREVITRARREGIRSTRETVRLKLTEETPVGYSSAGTVLEVGAAVSGFGPGDRVACASGHASHAEIVSVPANLCARVPDGVPLEAAALSTIGAIALHGIRLADVRVGDRVAVIGCGLVGQIACRLLRAAGAQVIAIDIDPARVEQAVAGGADRGLLAGPDATEHVLAATAGLGADEVLVTAAAPSNDPLLLAAEIARDRAAIVLVGDVPIEFPRGPLYHKELSFRISRSYGPGRYDADYEERGLDYPIAFVRWTEGRNMQAVLELQRRGQLTLLDLIDEVVSVEHAPRAYERLLGPSEQRPRGALLLSYADAEQAPEPESVAIAAPPARTYRASPAPIRVGLVGAGGFAGRVLVPALVEAGARLEIAGGGGGPSAEAATRRLGFARTAVDPQAVIADESVDAVVIATRHGTHAALVTEALNAGKHVFCEKPLALSDEELEEVLAAAATSEGILAVGFNRRFAPLLERLREFVAATGGPSASVYRVSAGRLEKDHWTHDLAQGGGRILGEGCHFVDSLAYVAGSPVTSVYAAGYGAPEMPVQARDNVVIDLSFANGSVGSVLYVSDGSGRLAKERLESFSGERTAILDDYGSVELFGPSSSEKHAERGQDKGHRREVAAFLAGASRGEPPVPLAEVANVSLATLAAIESLRTGRAIRIEAG